MVIIGLFFTFLTDRNIKIVIHIGTSSTFDPQLLVQLAEPGGPVPWKKGGLGQYGKAQPFSQ